MLQLSCLSGLSRLDVVVADCDGSCGGGSGPCVLHSELCCPNDSLDDDDTVVIEIIQDEQLLKDLAIAASLPSTTTGHHNGDNNVQAVVVSPLVVVPTRKRSWSLSLDMMESIPTRRRSPNTRRRGNGVWQPQGLVPRRGPRSIKRLERACGRCDSTETPHWRTGPDGPGTLCNACGIRYTREQCKAAADAAVVGDSEQEEGVVKLRENVGKVVGQVAGRVV